MESFHALNPHTRPCKRLGLGLLGVLGLLALAGVLYTSTVSPPLHPLSQHSLDLQEFQSFLSKYNKEYSSPSEFARRFKIFRHNKSLIQLHNIEPHDWALGLNYFADLSLPEFSEKFSFKQVTEDSRHIEALESVELPQYVDWREEGVVTSVKSQGYNCKASYAFAACGALEGAWALTGAPLVSLSAQQLIDCSGSYNNDGCDGGTVQFAFDYMKIEGLTSEDDYPYEGLEGACNSTLVADSVANMISYSSVKQDDYKELLKATAKGPVAAYVDANSVGWQFYSGGVLRNDCGTSVGHAVLITGYDLLVSNNQFWDVKNSWGSDWGVGGYIRIGLDPENPQGVCGLNMHAFYPRVN